MKIKIVTENEAHAVAWRTALGAALPGAEVTPVTLALHRVPVVVNGSRPDLLLVEVRASADQDALEHLAQAHPELEYVLVSHDLSPQFLLRAMRAGAREVLPADTPAAQVAEAVQRLARKRPAASAAPARHGEVLSVVSTKGGSGATFIAANLAHMLSAREGARVALIDLNLQFGDAVLFVSSATPGSHVADVASNIARLDADLLQASMIPVSPQMWALAAPEDPARAADVQPQHVEAILALARTMFDYIVVDTGRALSAVTLAALDQSDRIFPVVQLTLPFIRDARRLGDVFRSLDYPTRKIQWIVNRHQKNSEITLDDLKKALQVDTLVVLPNQYDVVASAVNQGVPVDKLAAGSAIAKALRDLATRIAPDDRKPGRGGWLSGLFRGNGTSA
jgi:pilus assembly protein CpaE